MKFLEREELGHYHTQTEFFKPFESIMKHAKSGVIREFALKAIEQMIRARARSIKSGWKSIFLIYSRYALVLTPTHTQREDEREKRECVCVCDIHT